MYSILVVDDEIRHRMGLSKMLKTINPSYTLYEAKNGLVALDLLKLHPIDIVITDIIMPKMNGLEFIEAINQLNISVKIIILSAYGQFEYAQKAISLGASDYLLKPVDKKNVEDRLRKVENLLSKENLQLQEKEFLQNKLTITLPACQTHYLNKLMNNTINEKELKQLKEVLPLSHSGVIMVTQLLFTHQNKANNEAMRDVVFQKIQLFTNNYGEGLSFLIEDCDSKIVSIIGVNNTIPDSSQLRDSLDSFMINIESDYAQVAIRIGVSHICDNTYSSMHEYYLQAQEALLQSFYLKEKIFFYAEDFFYNNLQYTKHNEEERLILAIKQLKQCEAVSLMNDIIQRILNEGYIHPHKLLNIIMHIMYNILTTIQDHIQPGDYTALNDTFKKKMDATHNYAQLIEHLHHMITLMIETLQAQKITYSDLISKECIDYIHAHYHEDLSLDKLSDMFFINSSYFSKTFKQITGKTYSQYILNLRLKKAKKMLLENNHYKIYEIAQAVGYKDPKYFNRIFKKKIGFTPEEFRRIKLCSKKGAHDEKTSAY